MFVDFKKFVKNNDGTTGKLPQAFVDYLSQELPEGINYSQDDEGVCFLTPETGRSMKIGGLIPKLNKQQKKVLGDNYTLGELVKYCNNSQKAVELVPAKDGKILVNDESVDMNQLIKNPRVDESNIILQQYMYPEEFPEESKVTLSVEDVSKELYVKRIANESIYVLAFETRDDDYFKVKFFIDENKIKSKFNISIKAEKIKTIEEVLIAMKLYNAFLNGSVLWDGKPVSSKTDKSKDYFDEKTINYWQKIREIEKYLNLQFTPNTEEISFQTECMVERLYQTLINKTPIIAPYNINSINGNGKSYESVLDYIGKNLMIKVDGSENFDLYNVNFTLYSISCIFNCVINDIEKKGKEYKYTLDLSEDGKGYVSVLYFPSIEKLEQFDVESNISLFEKAKRAKDYLEQ